MHTHNILMGGKFIEHIDIIRIYELFHVKCVDNR